MTQDALAHLPIEAVIFDMDGLLLDSESLAMDALVSAGTALGYDMPREFCYLMIGAPADKCRDLAIETYGEDFPLAEYFALQEQHLRGFVDTGRLRLKAGVGALLDELDARGLRRAIATSSSRARTDHHLALAGIAARFSHIVTRDDVSRGKPDPEPYLTAAARLGTAPSACLALEDSYNGVRAAHAAGMRVIMVPDLLPPTAEMQAKAYRVMRDLLEVAEYIPALYPATAG
jgi:HAD superfamily hydrolase (TIGR01509 family)